TSTIRFPSMRMSEISGSCCVIVTIYAPVMRMRRLRASCPARIRSRVARQFASISLVSERNFTSHLLEHREFVTEIPGLSDFPLRQSVDTEFEEREVLAGWSEPPELTRVDSTHLEDSPHAVIFRDDVNELVLAVAQRVNEPSG